MRLPSHSEGPGQVYRTLETGCQRDTPSPLMSGSEAASASQQTNVRETLRSSRGSSSFDGDSCLQGYNMECRKKLWFQSQLFPQPHKTEKGKHASLVPLSVLGRGTVDQTGINCCWEPGASPPLTCSPCLLGLNCEQVQRPHSWSYRGCLTRVLRTKLPALCKLSLHPIQELLTCAQILGTSVQ